MKKTLLSFFALVLATLTASAAVGDEFTSGGLKYKVTSDAEVEVSGYTADCPSALVIPGTVSDGTDATYLVTSIGYKAFYWSKVVSVELPASIKTIQEQGFYSMDNLASIKLNKGLQTIGRYGLAYNKLLTSVEIPEGVTELGYSAFFGCYALANITLPSSLRTIGGSCFYKCAFTKIDIPAGLETLGKSAFLYCQKLTDITLPNTIKTIGGATFEYCTKLTHLDLPASLESIGEEAFDHSGLEGKVTIPASVKEIGGSAWASTKVTEFEVESGNTKYSATDGILYNDELNLLVAVPTAYAQTEVVVPEKYIGIDAGAFAYSKVKKVTVGSKMRAINDRAFVLSELSEINMPESLVFIGEQAFAGTKLTNVVLPSKLPLIQNAAFAQATLASVTIPASVKEIANRAFWGCTSLNTINVEGATPAVLEDWYDVDEAPFFNVPSTAKVHVPSNALTAYTEDASWNSAFSTSQFVGDLAAPLILTATTPAAESTLESINTLTFTFDEDITLVKKEIEVYNGPMAAGVIIGGKADLGSDWDSWSFDVSGNTLKVMSFDMDSYLANITLNANKDYYFVIPAGAVKGTSGAVNEEITLLVKGAFDPTLTPEFDPADGADIAKFEGVTAKFESSAYSNGMLKSKIKVTKGSKDGAEVEVDQWNLLKDGTNWKILPQDMDGSLSPIAIEPGEDLYITLPEGLFTQSVTAGTKKSLETTLHYVNTNIPQLTLTESTPASGATLESIAKLTLTFNESITMVNEQLDVYYGPLDADGNPTGGKADLGNDWDSWNFKVNGSTLTINSFDMDYMMANIPLLKGKTYYFVIPAGAIKGADGVLNDKIQIQVHGSFDPVLPTEGFDPADGSELKSFEGVAVEFESAVYTNSALKYKIKATKGSATGTAVSVDSWLVVKEGTNYRVAPADANGFTSPIAIAEGEDLYITLPAGLFYLSGGVGMKKTEEIVLHYHNPATGGLDLVESNPADGSTVKTLGQISFTFSEDISIVKKDMKIYYGPLGADGMPAGGEVPTSELSDYFDSWGYAANGATLKVYAMDWDSYGMEINLPKDKDYYFVIPEGSVKGKTSGLGNKTAIVCLHGAYDSELHVASFDPADGTKLTEFDGVTVTFDTNAYRSYSLLDKVKATKGSQDGTAVSVDQWMIEVKTGSTTFKLFPADYDGFLTPIAIAEGEDLYVTLPAGLFYTSSGTKTVEIVLHYAATSGLTSIIVDGQEVEAEYYDLNGLRIISPVPGRIYIVKQGSQISKQLLKKGK